MALLLNRFVSSIRNLKPLLSVSVCSCNHHVCQYSTKVKKPAEKFSLFVSKNMPRIKEEGEKTGLRYGMTEQFCVLGAMWQELPEEEKRKYNAPEDEMAAYINYKECNRARKRAINRAIKKLKRELGCPKSIHTPFSIFLSEEMASYRKDQTTLQCKAIFKKAGEKWRTFTEEEKQVFSHRARAAKLEYIEKLEEWEEDVKSRGYPELCRDYRTKKGDKKEALVERLEIKLNYKSPNEGD